MTKPAETDTPLFGTQSDVLETAARSPIPSTSNTTTAAPETKAKDGDFFSSVSSSPSASEPSKSNGTGARNENSALFSLAQLSGSPDEKPAERKATSDSIIDIKALADGAPALSAILGDGGGIASPLAGPVLAPVPAPTIAALPSEPKSTTNKTVLFSVLGASLILGGGGLGAAMILRTAPAAPTHTSTNSPSTNTVAANEPSTATTPTNPTNAAGTDTPSTNAPAAGHEPGSHSTRTSESSNRAPRAARTSQTSSRVAQEAPAQTTPAPTQPTTPTVSPCVRNCRGDIGCILRCQAGGNNAQPASAPSSGGAREAPTRSEVMSAMNSVRSAVVACASGSHGTAQFTVTFAGSGRVTTVNVAPPLAATPAGSCAARAVRTATVPPFSRPTFQVVYPFSY